VFPVTVIANEVGFGEPAKTINFSNNKEENGTFFTNQEEEEYDSECLFDYENTLYINDDNENDNDILIKTRNNNIKRKNAYLFHHQLYQKQTTKKATKKATKIKIPRKKNKTNDNISATDNTKKSTVLEIDLTKTKFLDNDSGTLIKGKTPENINENSENDRRNPFRQTRTEEWKSSSDDAKMSVDASRYKNLMKRLRKQELIKKSEKIQRKLLK